MMLGRSSLSAFTTPNPSISGIWISRKTRLGRWVRIDSYSLLAILTFIDNCNFVLRSDPDPNHISSQRLVINNNGLNFHEWLSVFCKRLGYVNNNLNPAFFFIGNCRKSGCFRKDGEDVLLVLASPIPSFGGPLRPGPESSIVIDISIFNRFDRQP